MSQRHQTRAILLLTCWMLLGCMASILPRETQQIVRRQLRDKITPVLSLTSLLPTDHWKQQLIAKWTIERPSENTPRQLEGQKEEMDRLRRKTAALEILLKQEATKLPTERTESLFQPKLISARRLTGRSRDSWKGENWIDAGRSRKVREEDWILGAEKPLIDLGADHALKPDQFLLSGRTIIGQIDAVGRWSSTYRTVTEPQFRCPVEIIKPDREATPEQAFGSWHGTGESTCTIHYVENTAPVRVGDLVVLDQSARTWGQPLILGRVTRAVVKANSPFWEIEAEPWNSNQTVREVMVLSETVSRNRLANQTEAETETTTR